jgi:phage-related protein
MDIPTKEWVPGKQYSVDDIVRVWNLAMPPHVDPNDIKDEDHFAGKYSPEIEIGEIFEEKTITESTEVAFGLKFPVDPAIGYTAKAMVRKNDEDSDTIDPFLTHIELGEVQGALLPNPFRNVDADKSIGVGVGIKFYDSNLDYIQPEDQRMTIRPMASSELSHTEWYRVQLDIEPKHIPPTAEIGEVFIFLYGAQQGGFDFRKVEVTNLSKFFYCTEDHLSHPFNMPGGSSFWTQDFNWRPSYGSSSSFAAINEAMALGEGSDYSNNLAINSLPMELSLSFKGRTDKESKAIVHFLQEKHFAYESIFALDYRGSRLLSSDVQSFNFIYTHPYRKDLKFTCVDFSHSMDYRNNNTVSAKFVCNTESSIKSVESHSGYNERIDAVFPAYIDKDTDFVKGKKMKLNSFSLEDGEDGGDKSAISLEGLIDITPFGDIVNGIPQAGLLSFNKDQDLKVGDCIYVNVLEPEDSIYSIGLGKIFKVIDSKKFVFGKGKGYVDGVLYSSLLSEGSTDDVSAFAEISTDEGASIDSDIGDTLIANIEGEAPVEIKKLFFCPQDCLPSQPILPDTECGKKVSHKMIDPATGEYRKRVIMLKNYRKLQLETDIDADTFSIDVVPLSSFTLTKEDDFQMLIPAVCGRSSIYIEDPDKITKYPWIKIRNFEHKPTLGFNLANRPKHHQSNFLKFYNKKYKKSINQNMSTFSLTFDKRDDEEAAEILQFLESHLGYKKFRFTMPRPYLADDSSLTTQSRSYNSVFYCPSWDHQLAYKNNHTITATFIESSTGLQEDFANPEGPCYGANVYDPVTEHNLCTFSSVAVAKFCGGSSRYSFDETKEMSRKSVDIVFIVDTTPSMTRATNVVSGTGPGGAGYSYTKYKASMDLVLKMITAYDNHIVPGTLDYDGSFNAPAISQTEPPWPVDSSLNTLIDPSKDDILADLIEKGYDVKKLEDFKIKIERSRVNIGLVLVGDPIIVGDVSDVPLGFDKKIAYDTILPHRDNTNYEGAVDLEYYTKCFSQSLAQLYNSPRAEYVSDRIIIMLSDGLTEAPDAVSPNGSMYGIGAPGRPDPTDVAGWRNTWSPQALKICEELRRGGELAKRRPSDSVLGKAEYTHVDTRSGSQTNNPLEWINQYSSQNNPDNGSSNPDWYNEEIPTVVMWASMGNPDWISDNCPKYAYDYDPNEPDKELEFYFPISTPTGGVDTGEVSRLISLMTAVEKITSDTGYENIFCVSIKNCGPHPVKILNSIVNLKSEASPLSWTTEVLEAGIPKGGNYKDLESISPQNDIDNIKLGYGGQYHGDSNNTSFLSNSAFGDESSNMLWESFNTEREVIRDGEHFEINGGWSGAGGNNTAGVYNTGVAFRGMPIRVFKSESGVEVIDYNIGGVDLSEWSESPKGDYNHLPMLGRDEVIDLFFGIRIGSLHSIGDEIQIVLNTEDDTKKKMDCYANIEIPINLDPA